MFHDVPTFCSQTLGLIIWPATVEKKHEADKSILLWNQLGGQIPNTILAYFKSWLDLQICIVNAWPNHLTAVFRSWSLIAQTIEKSSRNSFFGVKGIKKTFYFCQYQRKNVNQNPNFLPVHGQNGTRAPYISEPPAPALLGQLEEHGGGATIWYGMPFAQIIN